MTSHPAAAQEEDEPPSPDYWINVFYPKLFYTSRDELTVGGYFAFIQPLRFEDFETPPPYRTSVSANGQFSTSGSWLLRLEWQAPGSVEGWRFRGTFETRRRAADNYFGIGPNTTFDADSVTDTQPNFYRAENTRNRVRGQVERRIVGPLRILVGFQFEHYKIDTLPGNSVLANDLAAGVDPTIGVGTNDFSGRIGLVLDTRNDEVAPERGILIEAMLAGADADIAGDLSYTRATLSARGYVSFGSRLTVAGRVAGETMGGTPRFGTYYTFEASERPYRAYGGPDVNRGLFQVRFLDADKLLGNLEARYTLHSIPTLSRVSLIGFVDAGRVFDQGDFRLTFDDVKVGGGAGLVIQIARAGIIGVSIGTGPDGVTSNFHTRWSF